MPFSLPPAHNPIQAKLGSSSADEVADKAVVEQDLRLVAKDITDR